MMIPHHQAKVESEAKRSMTRTIRGESTSGGVAQDARQHYGSNMPMPSCIFHIVVDRMIVSRIRLEGRGVCISKCAAWGPENVADA
jgi:hypothetical protein